MKALLIGILIMVLLIGGYLLYLRGQVLDKPGMELELTDYEGDALEECIYSVAGGELNMFYELDMLRKSNGWAVLKVSERAENGADESSYECLVSEEILDQIQAIAEEHGMYAWGELPESEMQVLDAPSTYMMFKIQGKTFDFSDSRDLPDGAFDAIREIRELMESEYKDKQN